MFTTKEQNIIDQAISIIESKALVSDLVATSSRAVKEYCQLHLGNEEREHFGVLFLNNQHELIEFNIMFKGTIDAAAVYPREILKHALKVNAAAIILTHNHPSGVLRQSVADVTITTRIKKALNVVDITLLDHVVVSSKGAITFTENGVQF